MGTGKKKKSITVKGNPDSYKPVNSRIASRNLNKGDLAGVIFGCTHYTMDECLSKFLFGLPGPHFLYVKNIYPGMPLFLFNYSDRKLHGIFEAASHGQWCIDSKAWLEDGWERTRYPAQVRVKYQVNCLPLHEEQFKPVIAQNYYELKHFWFELDQGQTRKFVSIFSPSNVQPMKTKLINNEEEPVGPLFAQTLESHSVGPELEEANCEIQQLEDQSNASESGWLEDVKVALNELIDEHNIESLQNSLFIVGGFDGVSWLSALDQYYPPREFGQPCHPMPFVRPYASAVKSSGELYVLGGVDGDICYNSAEVYSPTNNQWTGGPPLNQKKGCLAGIALDCKIFALGGGDSVEPFADVEMLDTYAGRWIFTQSMLQKRYAPAAAEINGILYVVGGYDGKGYLKTAERFDPREHSWSRIASMRTRRGCHSLVALNDKLYALGGHDGGRMVSSVEILDPRKGSWSIGEPMNYNRGYFGTIKIADSIYAIGGVNDEGRHVLDTVECYKEGQGWKLTDQMAIGRRCCFSAIVM